MRTKFAVLEAPSVLGLFPNGVERLPDALLGAGLADRLDARRAGRVVPPPYDEKRDPETGVRNAASIAGYSIDLADAIGEVLDRGEFPVVLGGDCSILLGCLLALRRRGRAGLLFLDGHADFYQPEAEPNGEAASMELAFATGRGPGILSDIEGRRPLLSDEDVVVVGRRDGADAEKHGSQRIEDTQITMFDLSTVRALGAEAATTGALAQLPESFWIHVDADVLDDRIMPAVDYRMPGGLTWQELSTVLNAAMASKRSPNAPISSAVRPPASRAVGIDITIFNPRLDDGGIAQAFAEAIGGSLRTAD
ncbi:MAG: arginase family protein [Dehalococcoidia bacterium]|nr:arginase family protein [Dehalococcoidia bacterium]